MGKILLVDDTRTMLEVLKVLLQGRGHDLVTALDGRQALYAVRRERPDVVISDVMMPNMDGLEFVRELKQTAGLENTPVILISSRWNTERRAEALRSGAVVCLEKPLQEAWLIKVVDRLMRPISSSPPRDPSA